MPPHEYESQLPNDVPQNVVYNLLHADCVCFDVDSTMITTEGIDELARYAGVSSQVEALTKKAMGGTMSFREALTQRLNVIRPSQDMVNSFLKETPGVITAGFKDVVREFTERGTDVHLVSGGFERLILHSAEQCDIPRENIHSNLLIFTSTGEYAGFDKSRMTSESMGKARVFKTLKADMKYKRMAMFGDGMTDSEAKPPADIFIGFGGNVERAAVKEVSDWYIYSWMPLLNILRDAGKK